MRQFVDYVTWGACMSFFFFRNISLIIIIIILQNSNINKALVQPMIKRKKKTSTCYFIAKLSQRDKRDVIWLEIAYTFEYEWYFDIVVLYILKFVSNYQFSDGNSHFWHYIWVSCDNVSCIYFSLNLHREIKENELWV